MSTQSIGFIGGGRVVRILLSGWKQANALPNNIVVSDPNAETLAKLKTDAYAMAGDHRKSRRATSTSERESETMKTKPKCYGSMFPDLCKLAFNTPNEGKAFTVMVGSSRGITERQSSVKIEGWDAFTECPEAANLSGGYLTFRRVTALTPG